MSNLRQQEFNSLKILHHIDRLRALAEGKDITPVTVEIDPVAYCNHNCGWCVDPLHYSVKMSEEMFEALVSELADFSINGFRVEGIVFKGGGEPTLHHCFGDMVNRAVGLGFSIGVVTNGSRLSYWAESLARRASYVRVSIDGPTPESHRRIHRSKDFDKILKGTERLVAMREGRRHPIIGLSFAMDIHSVELAPEAVKLGERLDVDYVLLRPPFFEEVGREPTMSILQAQKVRWQLREIAANYQGSVEIFVGNWIGDAEQKMMKGQSLEESGRRAMQIADSIPIEHRTGKCFASPVLAVVAADGRLYGCCNLRALPRWSFGQLDYRAGIGFSELWQGEQRKAVLACMHRTECIQHCTHPVARYNEIIEVLKDEERPHSQFV